MKKGIRVKTFADLFVNFGRKDFDWIAYDDYVHCCSAIIETNDFYSREYIFECAYDKSVLFFENYKHIVENEIDTKANIIGFNILRLSLKFGVCRIFAWFGKPLKHDCVTVSVNK